MLSRIPRNWLSRLRHLSDEELLSYLDGELAARQAAKAKRHLEACWDCRSRLRQMEGAIEALARWRPAKLHAEMTPPPKGWREFPIRLEQLASRPVETESARRWTPGPRFWKFAGAAVAVTAVVLWLPEFGGFRLSAKELIAAMIRREAGVVRSVEQGVLHRTVRVSCTPPEFLPEGPGILENWYAPDRGEVRREGNRQLWAKLQPVFQANSMAPEDALSAASFSAWRASLQNAVDAVRKVRLGNGAEGWLLETKNKGPVPRFGIAEAELLVRASDWWPVRQVLRFRTAEGLVECEFATVRFEALPSHVLPSSLFAARPAPRSKARQPEPRKSRVESAGGLSLRHAEVEVFYALHRLGECRRGAFEVRRTTQGTIELRGVASSEEELRQIAAAVEGIPGLTLSIQTPTAGLPARPDTRSKPSATILSTRGGIPAESELKRLLSDEDASTADQEVAAFSTTVVSLSQEAWAQAWALHRLVKRFPPPSLSRLGHTSQWLVEVMVRDHSTALQRTLEELEQRLAPLAGENRTGLGPSAFDSTLPVLELSRQILDVVSEANSLSLELFTVSDTAPRHADVRGAIQQLVALIAAAREGTNGFYQTMVRSEAPETAESRYLEDE